MTKRWKLLVSMVGLVLALLALGIGCATETATPTPTKAPVATATATPTVAPTATSRPGTTPTQVVSTPTPTSTSTPVASATAKPVVLRAGNYFWSKNDPLMDHYSNHMHSIMFDRVTWVNENGDPQAELATKWELVNPTTWRFTLRNDVKFHDGTPVTAKDVKFTFDNIMSRPGSYVINIKYVNGGTEVVDNYTVDLKTKSLDVSIPWRLTSAFVLPKDYIEKVGWDKFVDKPIGSGPWKWTEWVAWDHTFAERAWDHPARKVSIDRIELWDIPQVDTAYSALRTGAIELAGASFFPEQAKELEKRGFDVHPAPAAYVTGTFYPKDSCRLKRATCDARVRRALNLAVDRQLLVDTLWLGYAQIRNQPGTPTEKAFIKDSPLVYDPKAAEKLLDEAGYPKDPKSGVRLEIKNCIYWNPGIVGTQILAIVDMWKAIGVNVSCSLQDIGVALDYYYRKEGKEPPEIFWLMSGGGGSLGDNMAAVLGPCTSFPACQSPYENPEFYTLQDKVRSEPDRDKRMALTEQSTRILANDALGVYSTTMPIFYIYANRWDGIRVDGFGPNWDNMKLVK